MLYLFQQVLREGTKHLHTRGLLKGINLNKSFTLSVFFKLKALMATFSVTNRMFRSLKIVEILSPSPQRLNPDS